MDLPDEERQDQSAGETLQLGQPQVYGSRGAGRCSARALAYSAASPAWTFLLTVTACVLVCHGSVGPYTAAVNAAATLRITSAVCTTQLSSRARVLTDASTSEHPEQPDVIHLSHDGSVRTVVVAAACPAAMQRNTPW